MAHGTIKLSIPFESLVAAVAELSLEDKLVLSQVLEEQLAQAEEEAWEQQPAALAEIEEARAAYEAGDYLNIDDYVARRADGSTYRIIDK